MLNKIEGITLLVSDIKRSVEFYRDILNLRVNKESEDKIEFSKKDSTNTKLIIELDKTGSNKNNKSSVIITFSVIDLNTIYDKLTQRKVDFHKKLSEDETGKNTIIRDPDGYLISLTEPIDEFAQIPYYHGFAPA
ncbi:MAG TPA: VOC family protein [Nitrososphaeraceae archaeon]|nr:VOC family protein [Nitrososphaeraceae archaeon]HEU5172692.1 VOC family protein [Nitrososphaeraceae archaeon]